MSDKALKSGEVRLYDRFEPLLQVGKYPITLEQLLDAEVDGGPDPIIEFAKTTFTLDVDGPQLTLDPSEVLACYPSPGTADAPTTMLPHVVLRRRTLPWERSIGAEAPAGTPWMALLLLEAGEHTLKRGEKCDTLTVKTDLLRQILPSRHELALLCHARQVSKDDRAGREDDDGFVAIVVGNRLPSAKRAHLACLVSLKDKWDVVLLGGEPDDDPPAAHVLEAADLTTLVALHSWTFHTPDSGDGGDYEPIIKAVGDKAATFGLAVEEATVAGKHRTVPCPGVDAEGTVTLCEGELARRYRGPLVPKAVWDVTAGAAPDHERPKETDGSIGAAAAFELGRLLTLANPIAMDALLDFRSSFYEVTRREALLTMKHLPPEPALAVRHYLTKVLHRKDYADVTRADLGVVGDSTPVPLFDPDKLVSWRADPTERAVPAPEAASIPEEGPAVGLSGVALDSPDLGGLLEARFAWVRDAAWGRTATATPAVVPPAAADPWSEIQASLAADRVATETRAVRIAAAEAGARVAAGSLAVELAAGFRARDARMGLATLGSARLGARTNRAADLRSRLDTSRLDTSRFAEEPDSRLGTATFGVSPFGGE